MTKKQTLEVIEKRINWVIEKEIDSNQSDWDRGYDIGFNEACKHILEIIKTLK